MPYLGHIAEHMDDGVTELHVVLCRALLAFKRHLHIERERTNERTADKQTHDGAPAHGQIRIIG